MFHVERYLPRQKRPNKASSTSSTPARPVSRSKAPRASRRSSAISTRSVAEAAASSASAASARSSACRRFRAMASSVGRTARASRSISSSSDGRPVAGQRRYGERSGRGRASVPAGRPSRGRDQSRMARRVVRLAQPDQHVGGFDEPPSPFDADRLDLVAGFTQPRGVGQPDRNAAERQRHLDMIAGGARDGGDDRSLLTSYSVDKA